MADKLTQLILDALTKAAADPGGVPLYASKSEPGLFPPAAAARPAVKKCLDDGLIRVVRTETKGKTARELCAATEKGLQFLLEQVSPKQVLEDFVRVMEQRESQVAELLDAANHMAASLAGLKATVSSVLPRIETERIAVSASRWDSEIGATGLHSKQGTSAMNGTATLDAPARVHPTVEDELEDLAGAVLARLSDWSESAGAGQDCPLPELYRSLTTREPALTIGRFHDCLRHLHDRHAVYLHPWTGPLYALPEPPYALLVGHEIAYYASGRSGQWSVAGGQ